MNTLHVKHLQLEQPSVQVSARPESRYFCLYVTKKSSPKQTTKNKWEDLPPKIYSKFCPPKQILLTTL